MGMIGSQRGQNVEDRDPHSQMAGGDRWVLWALASSLAPECTHQAE